MTASRIIEAFTEQYNRHFAGKNGPLSDLRNKAFDHFSRVGFPKTKDEEWRFTDITPLLEVPFGGAEDSDESTVTGEQIAPYLIPDPTAGRIVFVDGFFAPRLSDNLQNAGFDIFVVRDKQNDDKLADIIENSPSLSANSFSALNSALFREALFIHVPDGLTIEHPLQILYVSTKKPAPQAVFPRMAVRLRKNSRLTLIESYFSADEDSYFVNAVSDVHIEANASLKHIRIQQDSGKAFHIGNTFAAQKADSRYYSYSFSFGSRLSRHQIETVLDGAGAESVLNGLYLGKNEQLLDNHTLIRHHAAHCQSHELYRGVLAEKARGVFSGKILVERNAQKTDAVQNNNCLLLSEEARIDSKPQLEIYADDVRCTHGATVGQLDEEALFYLKSRGIGHNTAKNILIYAFAEEVLKGIDQKEIRRYLDGVLNTFFNRVAG